MNLVERDGRRLEANRCRDGLLAAEVRGRVRSYTGVDFSQPFIDLAVARAARLGASNLQFTCASIEPFCAAHPARFDVACAFDFSEHVRDDEWLRLLEAMRGALKPGGRLYLHTPNAAFILERMKASGFILLQSIPLLGMLLSVFIVIPLSAVIWLLMMFKAYQGERFKLPIAGEMAEQRI